MLPRSNRHLVQSSQAPTSPATICNGSALDFLPPLGLKNKLGVLVRGVLLLRLELSVTAQERFNAGRAGELTSVLPPTSASVELADDLRDNAYRDDGETYSKV